MGKTSIEWAEHSVNPIRARNLETGAVGHFCIKCSPECARCYASEWNSRVRPSGKHLIGTGLHFLPVNQPKVETFLDESKLDEVIRRKKPTAYFWLDMTDLFGDWVPDWMIDRCYAVMALTPRHTHMILTKRAERMRAYFTAPDLYDRILKAAAHVRAKYPELGSVGISDPALHPPRWIYKGVSVGNQPMADRRIPDLLQTPAAVRFLSCEPLLGPVNLAKVGATLNGPDWHPLIGWKTSYQHKPRTPDECAIGVQSSSHDSSGRPHPKLDWVISGGESGGIDARLSHPDWFKSLRDQCAAAGVPYLHKQNGAWLPFYDRDVDDPDWRNVPKESARVRRINLAGGMGFHGERVVYFRHVGKKRAGRLLDGRVHDEFPAVQP